MLSWIMFFTTAIALIVCTVVNSAKNRYHKCLNQGRNTSAKRKMAIVWEKSVLNKICHSDQFEVVYVTAFMTMIVWFLIGGFITHINARLFIEGYEVVCEQYQCSEKLNEVEQAVLYKKLLENEAKRNNYIYWNNFLFGVVDFHIPDIVEKLPPIKECLNGKDKTT